MTNPDGRSVGLTDENRTTAIDERLALAVVVGDDGRETWWLLTLDASPDAVHGCGCRACAPHEQA